MEKLEAKKKIKAMPTVNKKSSNTKSSNFKNIIKKHIKYISILLTIFVLIMIMVFLAFNKNLFYEFLNRPKILQRPIMLLLLLILSAVLCIIEFFVNLFYLEKSKYGLIRKNKLNESIKSKRRLFKLINKFAYKLNINKLKFKKKTKKFKFAYKKTKKSNGFEILKLNIYKLVMLLLLCLSFKIKILWVCVVAIFAVCVLNINLLNCNKTKQNRVINIIMLLINICIFLSFYLLYLLN